MTREYFKENVMMVIEMESERGSGRFSEPVIGSDVNSYIKKNEQYRLLSFRY